MDAPTSAAQHDNATAPRGRDPVAGFLARYRARFGRLEVYTVDLPSRPEAWLAGADRHVALRSTDAAWPAPAELLRCASGARAAVVLAAPEGFWATAPAWCDPWRRALSGAFAAHASPWCALDAPADATSAAHALAALGGYTPRMNALSRRCVADLAAASRVRLRTALGTDLALELVGRKVYTEDDFSPLCDPECQFPGGETFVAPAEDRTDGWLVLPFSAIGARRSGSFRVRLEAGRIARVEVAGSAALARRLETALRPGDVLGEFAVGLNAGVDAGADVPWTEKALGTIHLGFGDNTHFGGAHASARHYDLTVGEPELSLDGEPWTPWSR